MEEIEFQKALPHIRKILKYALDSTYSDFYRKKYQGLNIKPENIKTYEDFKKIPLLTKDEILSRPLSERFFVSGKDIGCFSLSSGTTNNLKPMATPRLIKEKNFLNPEPEIIDKLNIKRMLLLLPITRAVERSKTIQIPYLVADPQRLALAAEIAKEAEVDGIITTPTILNTFSEILKKSGFDLNKVRYLSLSTEYCSEQRNEFFKKTYPASFIRYNYGNSEVGGIVGYRCFDMAHEEPNKFHINPANFLEVGDAQNTCLHGEGEFIVTHLYERAFPLIRYCTSDVGSVSKYKCDCGNTSRLTLKGKKDMDHLPTSGGILHVQMIASAIEKASFWLNDDFVLHINEKTGANGVYDSFVLDVIPKDTYKAKDKPKVEDTIAKNLYLSPGKSINDFVEAGIIESFKIRTVESIPGDPKPIRIVREST